MLILSRRPGEKIIIECKGMEIAVGYQRANGCNAVFSIEADKSINIYREELRGKKKKHEKKI